MMHKTAFGRFVGGVSAANPLGNSSPGLIGRSPWFHTTLFIRRDEVEAAWSIVDPIRTGWGDEPLTEREFYAAGSWGPVAAEQMLSVRGHSWRNPQAEVGVKSGGH